MSRAKVDVKTNPLSAYLLLDRSGSMTRNWEETIGAMNAYVTELADDKDAGSARVTLAMFDAPHSDIDLRVLRRSEPVTTWKAVTQTEAMPRGYTPLYDAIGRVVAMANEDAAERAVIVVITDGAENRSREMTRDGAKAALDRCRERGWQIVFIGADFDAFSQAKDVGTVRGQTMSMESGNYAAAVSVLAKKTKSYRALAGSAADPDFVATATQSMTFNDEDRAAAVGKTTKDA